MSSSIRDGAYSSRSLTSILSESQERSPAWPLFPPAAPVRIVVRCRVGARDHSRSVVLPAYRWLIQETCSIEELRSSADCFRDYAANHPREPDVIRYLPLFALTIAASVEPAAEREVAQWIKKERSRLWRRWSRVLGLLPCASAGIRPAEPLS